MELKDLLLEFRLRAHGNTITKKQIDDKLENDDINKNIEVDAPKGASFDYNDGEGKVRLKCKEGSDHRIVGQSGSKKTSFNDLEKRTDKNQPLCYNCADEQKLPTPGTSRSELDIVSELEKFMKNVINKNGDVSYKIHFGNDKFKSDILSTKSENGGKRTNYLDYDIYIKDEKDGSKNVAINVDGPNHRINAPNRPDDVKRVVYNYKNKRNFLVFTDATKEENKEDFNDTIKKIKDFLLDEYNAWGEFKEQQERKHYLKRGLSDEAVNSIVDYKRAKHDERINNAKERINNLKAQPIREKMADVIKELSKNGFQYYNYKGINHRNLIDYLINTDEKTRSELYAKDSAAWEELIKLKDDEKIKEWIKTHQAKTHEELLSPHFLRGKSKLFENKN